MYVSVLIVSIGLLCSTGELYIQKSLHILSFVITLVALFKTLVFLAPTFTVGETKGAMDSASVLVFTSFFAYNFVRK